MRRIEAVGVLLDLLAFLRRRNPTLPRVGLPSLPASLSLDDRSFSCSISSVLNHLPVPRNDTFTLLHRKVPLVRPRVMTPRLT